MATQVAVRNGREEARLAQPPDRGEHAVRAAAFRPGRAGCLHHADRRRRGVQAKLRAGPTALSPTRWDGTSRLWCSRPRSRNACGVDDGVLRAAEALQTADTSRWTGADFAAFAREHGARALFHDWSPAELEQVRSDGKIPKWQRWREELLAQRISLDELMSVSALGSFITDADRA